MAMGAGAGLLGGMLLMDAMEPHYYGPPPGEDYGGDGGDFGGDFGGGDF